MKTKKLLSIVLPLVLLLSMLVTAVPVVSAETEETDTYYSVTILNETNAIISNPMLKVKKGDSYYTTITTGDKEKMLSLEVGVIMDDGTIVRPEVVDDYTLSVNIPKVTGNLYISAYIEYETSEPGLPGRTTYGLGIRDLVNVESNRVKDDNDYRFTNGDFIHEETFIPKEGYEIKEIKILRTEACLYKPVSGEKNYNYSEEDRSERATKNEDGSYTFKTIAQGSYYFKVVAEKITPDPKPTEPTPTKPIIKTPTISPATASLKAGEVKAIKVKDGKIKSWATSNKKIATVKNGKVTAFTKGAVKITVTLTTGKKLTCKVKVTTSPKLSKNKINVKKSKIVSVKLTGKATSINNKYTSTKRAKIVSKTNAKTIKVKGLKKGTSTVKVKVNGVTTLNLKVQVK